MAGGIFTDRPFEANPKCIVIAATAAAAYWWLPHGNALLLPVIFIVVYILLAWYDYLYNCDTKLYSGQYGPVSWIDSIFKPQRLDDGDTNPRLLSPDAQVRHKLMMTYAFHLFAVAPVLLYVAHYGPDTPRQTFQLLGALGIGAAAYHGGRLVFG